MINGSDNSAQHLNSTSLLDQPAPSILFLDDDQRILQSLGSVLESFGYKVTRQFESHNISSIVQQEEFDLVLTDLKMAEQDGLEVLKMVKLYQPLTPVVILTGFATIKSTVQALKEGAYGYLIKPCSVDELRMTVERGIAQKQLLLERKSNLAALQEKNDELTVTLQELKNANELLTENEQFREMIVSMFTHDIFNPVTSIKGFTNILINRQKSESPTDQLTYLNTIQRNVKKVEHLLNTFQTFYMIDHQTYEVHLSPKDLRDCVNDALRSVDFFAMERQVTIETSIPDAPIMVDADHFELERAIVNIIYNAIKFSKVKGTIQCVLSLAEDTASSEIHQAGTALLTIRDNGIGIAPSDQQKIFQKLYRGDNSLQFRGSGLGLYISHAIIELHRGRITVDSSIDEGSCFSVYLPLLSNK